MAYFEKNLPGVQPTAEEFFNGKLHAYTLAVERLRKAEEEQKRKDRLKSFTEMWSAEKMKEVALQNAKAMGIQQGFDFVLDEYNTDIFHLLCLYFTNNSDFEKHGFEGNNYSLKKGIWLQSPERGTGKTVLLRSFFINKRSCFGYKHTTELAVTFQKSGYEGIDRYIGLISQPPAPTNFYQDEAGFMYDELFSEDKVNHMGSPVSISSYIINKLYDFSNNNKTKKYKFHCTSNVDGEDIERIAGKTYRSRMPDMFNLIKLTGPDRRRG